MPLTPNHQNVLQVCCANPSVLQQILDCPPFPQKAELMGLVCRRFPLGSNSREWAWERGKGRQGRRENRFSGELLSWSLQWASRVPTLSSWDPLRKWVECAQNCSLRNGEENMCSLNSSQGLPPGCVTSGPLPDLWVSFIMWLTCPEQPRKLGGGARTG